MSYIIERQGNPHFWASCPSSKVMAGAQHEVNSLLTPNCAPVKLVGIYSHDLNELLYAQGYLHGREEGLEAYVHIKNARPPKFHSKRLWTAVMWEEWQPYYMHNNVLLHVARHNTLLASPCWLWIWNPPRSKHIYYIVGRQRQHMVLAGMFQRTNNHVP